MGAALLPNRRLVDALRLTRQLAERVDRNPLRWQRWSRPQAEFLRHRAARKMIRTGNRFGKSYVAVADLVYRAERKHPYRPDWNTRPGPVHQWLVTISWRQSVPLQKLLRDMLPEYVIQPKWDPGKGWGKDSPTLIWPDGSTIGIRTMEQGPRAFAGAELDHILIDEPCAAEHFRELERRVITRAGELTLAMTPINAPGDLQWLRDLVAEGVVADLHYRMTVQAFTFEDGSLRTLPDGTLCDEEWIKEISRNVMKRFRDIVLHGEWDEIVTNGAFDEVFDRGRHLIADLSVVADQRRVKVALGIDHGTQARTETAVLVRVDESGEYPAVHVLDCVESTEGNAIEDDARGILAMLERNGIGWRDLDHVMGDIPHYGGSRVVKKSNQDLAYEIMRQLYPTRSRAGLSLTPPIRTAKAGKGSGPRGSAMRGISWLHHSMSRRGQFAVHPDAIRVAECIERYVGGSTDPAGHLIDALRYALDPWIRRGQTRYASR